MPQTIHDALKNWGRKQHQLPARNNILKAEILEKLPERFQIENTPRRIPWLSLGFAGLAVLIFAINASPLPRPVIMTERSMTGSMVGSSKMGIGAVAPDFYPYPGNSAPITDSREFLKTDYNSTIRTRDVSGLTSRIQTMVRGFDGRLDSVSASDKFGYIAFAIPASKLDVFRAEIKSLVPGRFYTEQIGAQNLLPQKQSIEEQQAQAEKTLANLRADRQQLISAHNRAVASIQARLNQIKDDPNAGEERENLNNQLAAENRAYTGKLNSLDSQIRDNQASLEEIKKQDQNLLDNVATVNGYISLSWISLWEIVGLYLPGPLSAWIFGALAIAAYLWHRRANRELFSPF